MSKNFLYNTIPGRLILKPLTHPAVSRLAGAFLDTKLSKPVIPFFVNKCNIDVSEYNVEGIKTFNEFFRRPLKCGMREFDTDDRVFCAPCDGLLTAYRIEDGLVLPVKQSSYTISSLLKSRMIADAYNGGWCMVFRLCVNHYHRYAYAVSGNKTCNRHIEGILHTVRPVALEVTPVFSQNTREYTVIKNREFGRVLQMEVGAMLVGRIKNHASEGCKVVRGTEKGFFEYGGSTIIVLVEPCKLELDNKITEASIQGMETPVIMGQPVGRAL
ncbi:MAG: phosphatidylserine decarboxylase [Lachnospiraceae bacterium]|nr:phosphatidylserine decarboxylase [Lachnospiraceae bacterium]